MSRVRVTARERGVLRKIGEAHKAFMDLDQHHPDDVRDYLNGVHIMQGLIMQRVCRRASKSFPMYRNSKEGWKRR